MWHVHATEVRRYVPLVVTGLTTFVTVVASVVTRAWRIDEDWAGWLLAAAVMSAGALSISIALALRKGKTAAGRHTCKRCGYDLRMTTSARCPECGVRIPIFTRADERVLAALRGGNVQEPEGVYSAPEDTLPSRTPAEPEADPVERLKRRRDAIRDLTRGTDK